MRHTTPSGMTRGSTGSARACISTGSSAGSRQLARSTAACAAKVISTTRPAPPAVPPGSAIRPSLSADTAKKLNSVLLSSQDIFTTKFWLYWDFNLIAFVRTISFPFLLLKYAWRSWFYQSCVVSCRRQSLLDFYFICGRRNYDNLV